MKLSIIVPVYNEERSILEILAKVRAQVIEGCSLEVVVIDDGSKDATLKLLENNPKLYDKLISQKKNGGKGAAVRAGLGAATGDYILFQDADLEYDPSEYAKLVQPALTMKADIVMGSRVLAPQFLRIHYFWNKLGNALITLVFNACFNRTFSDIYTCYFMFRRSLIDPKELKTNGFEQQAEILAKCVKRSAVHYDVPISYYGRTKSEGKKIRAYHTLPVLWTILKEAVFK